MPAKKKRKTAGTQPDAEKDETDGVKKEQQPIDLTVDVDHSCSSSSSSSSSCTSPSSASEQKCKICYIPFANGCSKSDHATCISCCIAYFKNLMENQEFARVTTEPDDENTFMTWKCWEPNCKQVVYTETQIFSLYFHSHTRVRIHVCPLTEDQSVLG
jgi:hypothetical protein